MGTCFQPTEHNRRPAAPGPSLFHKNLLDFPSAGAHRCPPNVFGGKDETQGQQLRYPGSQPTNLREYNSPVTPDRVKMNQQTRFKQKKPSAGPSLKWRASRGSASCRLCYSPLLICSVVYCAAAVGLQCGLSLPRPGLPLGAASQLGACRQPGEDQESLRGAAARPSPPFPPQKLHHPEML